MLSDPDPSGPYRAVILDEIDRKILRELDTDPRLPVALLAQRLGYARGTIHARLNKLQRSDVVRANSTRVRPATVGKPLSGIVRAEVNQHLISEAISGIEGIPEVLECFAPAGDTDLLLRVVAADAAELYRVSEVIRLCPGILRTSTSVILREVIPYRLSPLLDAY